MHDGRAVERRSEARGRSQSGDSDDEVEDGALNVEI